MVSFTFLNLKYASFLEEFAFKHVFCINYCNIWLICKFINRNKMYFKNRSYFSVFSFENQAI